MQEYNAAKEAVLAAMPEASVTGERNSEYPIAVRVVDTASGQTLWAGRYWKHTHSLSLSLSLSVHRGKQLGVSYLHMWW